MNIAEISDVVSGMFTGAAPVHDEPNTCCMCEYPPAPVILDGVMVCPDCNVVLGRHLDCAPEWRSLDESGDSSGARCGAAASELYPVGMGTVTNGGDGKHNQGWSAMPYKQRQLCSALASLAEKGVHESLPQSVITRAKHIYQQVSSSEHVKYTRRAGLVEGALYAAMISHGSGNGRTSDELVDMSSIPKSMVFSGARRVMNHMPNMYIKDEECRTRSYAARHVKNMDLPEHADWFSVVLDWLVNAVDSLFIVSRCNPPSVCSACAILVIAELWEDVGSKPCKASVCKAFGCSLGTSSRCLAMLRPYKPTLSVKMRAYRSSLTT
jgi:transcription initiation factor TFIIIB Brf1 subunit/transcription initiation factor TFIIB